MKKIMSQKARTPRAGQRAPRRGTRATIALLVMPLANLSSPLAWAQAQSTQDRARTDAGTISESQRKVDEKPALPRPAAKTVIRANTPKLGNTMAGVRMSVKGFRFEGVSGVSGEEIQKVLAPWTDRDLSFAEYEAAVHAVARYLRENGHPNAEVKVSRAQVRDGTIAVAIQGLTPGGARNMAEAAVPPQTTEPRVFVKEFRVGGSNAVAPEEVNARLAPCSDKTLSLKELDDAAAAVAGVYREKGFGLAQAFMPPQKIEDGVVAITVQPGIVDKASGSNGLTVTTPGNIVKPEVIQKIIARAVKPDEPLNTTELERALRIASEVPGVKSVKSDLTAGTQPGTTQVEAKVEEARRVTGTIWADNHGSRYVGANRINALMNINSPSGYGELFSLNLGKASGMTSYKVAGQVLAGSSGAKVGASTSGMKLDIGQEIAPLNLNSQSTINSLFASYPLQRGALRNTTVDASFDSKHFVNNLAGTSDNSRHIQLLTTSLSGDLVDKWGGQVAWGTSVGFGRVNLADTPAYQATDAITARTEGGFAKFNYNVARLKPLAYREGLSLYTSLSGQFASHNLDSAEKFQLGGPTGVRAYPVGEGLGDAGWLATAEMRYNLPAQGAYNPQVFGFFDAGGLRQYNNPWAGALPAGAPNGYNLKGAGVGVSVTRNETANLRLMYAHKVGSNPNPTITGTDADGLSKGGRIWIFGTINF